MTYRDIQVRLLQFLQIPYLSMLMFINCVLVQFDTKNWIMATAVQEKVPTILILDCDFTKC